MSLFEKLVLEALARDSNLNTLKFVVEKEILHQDILRIMKEGELLKDLTFIGGTCLRYCYSGLRLSEDLDFNGGKKFNKKKLSTLGDRLETALEKKYGLKVEVLDPIKETGNVDTWKIKVITRPDSKNIPAQKINIDICALESYERLPIILHDPYKVNLASQNLIIHAQSKEEIFIDKIIAFAQRPNRIKNRDLWDLLWLNNNSTKHKFELLSVKLKDREIEKPEFIANYATRLDKLQNDKNTKEAFFSEMQRFLLPQIFQKKSDRDEYWVVVKLFMKEIYEKVKM